MLVGTQRSTTGGTNMGEWVRRTIQLVVLAGAIVAAYFVGQSDFGATSGPSGRIEPTPAQIQPKAPPPIRTHAPETPREDLTAPNPWGFPDARTTATERPGLPSPSSLPLPEPPPDPFPDDWEPPTYGVPETPTVTVTVEPEPGPWWDDPIAPTPLAETIG